MLFRPARLLLFVVAAAVVAVVVVVVAMVDGGGGGGDGDISAGVGVVAVAEILLSCCRLFFVAGVVAMAIPVVSVLSLPRFHAALMKSVVTRHTPIRLR